MDQMRQVQHRLQQKRFVMRALKVYHIECFRCVACSRQLIPRDEFALREDGLFYRASTTWWKASLGAGDPLSPLPGAAAANGRYSWERRRPSSGRPAPGEARAAPQSWDPRGGRCSCQLDGAFCGCGLHSASLFLRPGPMHSVSLTLLAHLHYTSVCLCGCPRIYTASACICAQTVLLVHLGLQPWLSDSGLLLPSRYSLQLPN